MSAVESLPEVLSYILASRTFEKAPALRNLLAYLWQHRDECISEYAIATEALGRSPNFDARTDATVRVQIGRLRQRLDRFYEEEGRDCPERLSIPLGSHQIKVEHVRPVQDLVVTTPLVMVSTTELRRVERTRRWWIPAWAAFTLLLMAICGFQAYQMRSAALSSPSTAKVPWLWQKFFSNGRHTRMVLPTPIFFSFASAGGEYGHAVMLRDTEVNDFTGGAQSPSFNLLRKEFGPASLAENYTVTSDTFAAVQLARFLDGFGLRTSVNSSADAPVEALDDENVVAVGTWGTLRPLQPYLDRMHFRVGPHESFVEVRNPAPGEPRRVDSYAESGERSVWPGVIAFLPGMNGRTHLMVLAGRYTSTLVSALTSTNGLEQLNRLWKSKGSPAFFEVIINAELSGRGLVRAWPVVLHPYQNKT